jgi:hypothetical protein
LFFNNFCIDAGGNGGGCLIALDVPTRFGVDFFSLPLLDALDHFCHQIAIDPGVSRLFYAATTPDEMVALVQDCGIFIGPDDFRALLRNGTTEFWLVRGGSTINPIAHLQQVFRV